MQTPLGNINLDLDIFYKKENLPSLDVGDNVRVTVFLELSKQNAGKAEKEKERIQMYEGVIISKHKTSDKIDSTITVRKMFQGGGIEKVFILNSPWIKEIEVLRKAKVRKAKLYYLRERMGKSARLKSRF